VASDNDTIEWEPKTWPKWPCDLEFLRDPGDIARVDFGKRSKTTLRLYERDAEFICAHMRTRVWIKDRVKTPVTERDLTRLVLYLAYVGRECDCFRARWKYLDPGGKFCRTAAKETWHWIERTIGHQAIFASWATRDPIGPEFRTDGEVVSDGPFFDPNLFVPGMRFSPRR
jgi:hypothetical protein